MRSISGIRLLSRYALVFAGLSFALSASAWPDKPKIKYPNYNETPAHFKPKTDSFEYERRVVEIPMRDGIKLHTVIIVPKCAKHAGILLTRTPYNADGLTSHAHSGHLGPILEGYDNVTDIIREDCYIRVVQDIRGKYGSEGGYVMNRPLHDNPLNPTPVDDATDAYDTIGWLVKHVPESNGKVGIIGISYDGYEPLTALIHPNPALKVSVPMNPMVDGWMGDDWFHHGAFRQQNIPYIYEQEASRTNKYSWWRNYYDDYDVYMRAGSAAALAQKHGMQQIGFWRELVKHPDYDEFWQSQAMDKILAKQPLKVPVMLVAGLWDQEDIYGAPAMYRALEPKDKNNDMVYLAMGPWYHGQEIGDGTHLGAIRFGSDTGKYFREHILRPVLARYLKDDASEGHVAPVSIYATGVDEWEQLDSWPACSARGCQIEPTPLYLEPHFRLGFEKPTAADADYDQYLSDPAKPVPYRQRPIHPVSSPESTWHVWLVDNQSFASGRPDVLTYETPVLKHPVKISGRPIAHLVASTSGTDSDWVVKLVDVYPPQVAAQPQMGGYQLAVSMDVLRGRYRQSYSDPQPITPNKPLLYKFPLPVTNHVFLPGHRIMVQIQSSWFPLYDRNPQKFVPNIFLAKPDDYIKATQRVFHEPGHASYIELPLVKK
ncbi:MAG TPA: CocE/NonD family hydrolase [Gammaproteobacteria bacterium]|nr:CocE/NonD family hydrolase [Gammaproteobacteria bacterium]